MDKNQWYYWTKNQHIHFVRFREYDNKVATGIVKPVEDKFEWKINGPCWSTYEETGKTDTLDEAKQAVGERVMKIIAEEFKPEYVPYFG